MLARPALGFSQSLDMGRILDQLSPIPRALMVGHELDAVENTPPLEARHHRDRAPRHRIVVQVEAGVRCLANVRRGAFVAYVAVLR
jgi:hypothetical protein